MSKGNIKIDTNNAKECTFMISFILPVEMISDLCCKKQQCDSRMHPPSRQTDAATTVSPLFPRPVGEKNTSRSANNWKQIAFYKKIHVPCAIPIPTTSVGFTATVKNMT